MAADNQLPIWAPRVAQAKIRALYENDAQGIYDENLLDEVGWALLARCDAFLIANRAREGELPCPQCGVILQHSAGAEEILHCSCGWRLPWPEYFKTIQHKQLSGAEPVLEQFRHYVGAFPAAQTPQEKMLLIDRLIHGFHWYHKYGPTRPVAVNLIEGRLRDVVTFLDSLTYSDRNTPGVTDAYAQWDANINKHPDWYPDRCTRRT